MSRDSFPHIPDETPARPFAPDTAPGLAEPTASPAPLPIPGQSGSLSNAQSNVTMPAHFPDQSPADDNLPPGPFQGPVHRRQWTPAVQRRFLETLAETGCVSYAADAVGLSRESAYRFRRRTDQRLFAEGWTAALAVAGESLADIALERALEGNEEVICDRDGVVTGRRMRQDNRLLIFLLTHMHGGRIAGRGSGRGASGPHASPTPLGASGSPRGLPAILNAITRRGQRPAGEQAALARQAEELRREAAAERMLSDTPTDTMFAHYRSVVEGLERRPRPGED
ncbi:hypothetical protein B5C34_12865 [Pacificimonas flava]|uniref:Uncharacterized protein n=2 Tax=Pacificimonas TaxID=1960290 RepID=A0A219B7L9_9SPHN|nr:MULTISPECIES: hypothetical protein [Pacificimonas]MBZ6378440.1 hypothetical protein [Pacificimonas aurantium]OWV34261.1 hypothetical protein B5C34_12865 [Pacificimonas flava]